MHGDPGLKCISTNRVSVEGSYLWVGDVPDWLEVISCGKSPPLLLENLAIFSKDVYRCLGEGN